MAIQNTIKPTAYIAYPLKLNNYAKSRNFTLPILLPLQLKNYVTKATYTNSSLTSSQALTLPFIAGLIDGDGFIRTYKHTGEYELTMHIEDEPLLLELKQQFGGYIQKVLNKNAVRFHLNAKTALNGKETLIDLTNGLNGHIRNTIRVKQFKKLCQALGLEHIESGPLTCQDGYIAGLFVADGTIYMNCRSSAAAKKEKLLNTETSSLVKENVKTEETENKIQRILKGVAPLIEVKIANSILSNVENVSTALGFGISYFWKKGKNPRGHFCFYIKSEADILRFSQYMYTYQTGSVKHKRLNLVQDFYKLKKQKAHLPNASPALAKLWQALIRKWYSF